MVGDAHHLAILHVRWFFDDKHSVVFRVGVEVCALQLDPGFPWSKHLRVEEESWDDLCVVVCVWFSICQ